MATLRTSTLGPVDFSLSNHTIRVLKQMKITSMESNESTFDITLSWLLYQFYWNLQYLFHFQGSSVEVVLVDLLHCFLHKFLSPKFNNTTGGREEHVLRSNHDQQRLLQRLYFTLSRAIKVVLANVCHMPIKSNIYILKLLTHNPLLADDMGTE